MLRRLKRNRPGLAHEGKSPPQSVLTWCLAKLSFHGSGAATVSRALSLPVLYVRWREINSDLRLELHVPFLWERLTGRE